MIRTNAAGANLLTVSGSYGTTTAADVKVFQAANGLSATGNMDAATWKALSKASNSTNSTLSSGVYGKAGDTHPAFPSSIKLEDGRLMMVFTSAQHHLNNTQPQTTWKTYSSDGGYTWTKPVQIVLPDGYETTPAGLGIATSGPLKGHPILTTWSKSSTDGVHTKVTISADLQGNAWGELTDINSAFPGHQSLSASPIVQVDDTNFQQAVYVYAGQDGSSTAQTVGLTYDGTRFVVGTPAVIAAVQQGATPTSTSTVSPTAGTATSTASQNGQGQAPAPATPGTSTSGGTANTSSTVATNSISSTTGGFTESGMVKLPDGRLFALMRNDLPKGSTAAAGIYSSYSSDGGKTWTPPVRAFDGSGAPRVTVMSNGNLVVLYRKTDAKNPSAEQNSNAVYRVSTDNGVTWGAETSAGESAPFEMAYGTPIANSDGTVTFVYANETNGNVSHMVTTPNVKVTK